MPKSSRINHRFLQCRDALLIGGTGGLGTTLQPISTNASGNGSGSAVLTSVGVSSATLSAGVFTNGSTGNIVAPNMRGLFNKAVDFQWFRVSRARLVFVGTVGSTTPGSITLAAYTDPADVITNTTSATLSGRGSRTFDVASSSNRELSVPIPVDSSWKKVSSDLTLAANTAPYFGGNAAVVVANSITDLAFGAISWFVAGSTPSQASLGSLFIDYDVEFKNPIDSSLNN